MKADVSSVAAAACRNGAGMQKKTRTKTKEIGNREIFSRQKIDNPVVEQHLREMGERMDEQRSSQEMTLTTATNCESPGYCN